MLALARHVALVRYRTWMALLVKSVDESSGRALLLDLQSASSCRARLLQESAVVFVLGQAGS